MTDDRGRDDGPMKPENRNANDTKIGRGKYFSRTFNVLLNLGGFDQYDWLPKTRQVWPKRPVRPARPANPMQTAEPARSEKPLRLMGPARIAESLYGVTGYNRETSAMRKAGKVPTTSGERRLERLRAGRASFSSAEAQWFLERFGQVFGHEARSGTSVAGFIALPLEHIIRHHLQRSVLVEWSRANPALVLRLLAQCPARRQGRTGLLRLNFTFANRPWLDNSGDPVQAVFRCEKISIKAETQQSFYSAIIMFPPNPRYSRIMTLYEGRTLSPDAFRRLVRRLRRWMYYDAHVRLRVHQSVQSVGAVRGCIR